MGYQMHQSPIPTRLLGELVPDAPDRQHELGLLRVALDLLAQVRDVDVARPHVTLELALPQLLHDLLAAEHLTGPAGEQPQYLELRAREIDRLAAHRHEVTGEVDSYRPRLDRRRLAGRRAAVQLAAPELSPHPAEQLANREWLRDVVVGADLETDDLVDLGVLRREQDDRDRASPPHVSTQVEPAAPGHHDVEDQEVELRVVVSELLLRVVAVHSEDHVEALLAQRVPDRVANRGLVVRNQDPARCHHRGLHYATGVGAVLAAGRWIQKVLPFPSSDCTPISPPITSTMRCAIDSPRPNPSFSSELRPR